MVRRGSAAAGTIVVSDEVPHIAPVDIDVGAGDIAAGAGTQEPHHAGDIAGVSDPPGRYPVLELVATEIVDRLAVHVGLDRAGRDIDYPDTEFGPFQRRAVAEHLKRRLGCAIMAEALARNGVVDRRDVDDDAAGAMGLHPPGRFLAALERRVQIDLQHRLPRLERHVLGGKGRFESGIVDEDIDTGRQPVDRLEHRRDVGGLLEIGGDGMALRAMPGGKFHDEGFHLRRHLARMHDHMAACLGEAHADRPADAARPAGHQGRLAFQILKHRALLKPGLDEAVSDAAGGRQQRDQAPGRNGTCPACRTRDR